MRVGKFFGAMMTVVLLTNVFAGAVALPADDATKKLGAFLGKWQVEATFANGDKATSNLECRWSPQGAFLLCEQIVKMNGDETRQLTAYSYNSKENTYSYSTFSGPGTKPTTNNVAIQGNVWTYDSSYESNGKTTQVHNTNEFTDPRTEVFKIVTSDDGGAHWKPLLEGKAHKTAD